MVRQVLIILLVLAGNFAVAQTAPVSQAEVKAVFLFNFTSFVDWPSHVLADPQEPLVIGILGKNPFGKYLENAIRNEKKGTHPLVIKYFATAEEVKGCHILYINKLSTEDLDAVLKALKGRSILTVGDTPYFALDGGMIRFFVENNKVRLQVNMAAVKAANLEISSKLLRVADIINSTQP